MSDHSGSANSSGNIEDDNSQEELNKSNTGRDVEVLSRAVRNLTKEFKEVHKENKERDRRMSEILSLLLNAPFNAHAKQQNVVDATSIASSSAETNVLTATSIASSSAETNVSTATSIVSPLATINVLNAKSNVTSPASANVSTITSTMSLPAPSLVVPPIISSNTSQKTLPIVASNISTASSNILTTSFVDAASPYNFTTPVITPQDYMPVNTNLNSSLNYAAASYTPSHYMPRNFEQVNSSNTTGAYKKGTFLQPSSSQMDAFNAGRQYHSGSINQSYVATPYEQRRKLLDLPVFSGKPEEWPKFFTCFNETTNSYGYTNVENHIRLEKSLKGEAKAAVESLMIHPQNVTEVIGQLQLRFGHPDKLIKSQIFKVREMAPIHESRSDQIIDFSIKVQNLKSFMEACNSPQHLNNPVLLEELVLKLPIRKREEWVYYSSSIEPYPTIQHFSMWLSQIAKIMSRISTSIYSNDNLFKQAVKKTNTKSHMFYAKEQQSPKSITRGQCKCCQKHHATSECYKFIKFGINDKWNFVKTNSLCFSCLNDGHAVRECTERQRCKVDGCTRPHHPLLHNKKDKPQLKENQEPDDKVEQLMSCKSSCNSLQTLFRILPVTLYGRKSEIDTYAFLDEGSSLTVIDEGLANELGLQGKTKRLTLQWYGNKSSSEMSKTLDLGISERNNKRNIYNLKNVQTVKDLSLPMQTVDITQMSNNSHFSKLPITKYDNAVPKILIGLDNCHLGLPSRVVKGSMTSPVATKTKLGWTVFGPQQKVDTNHWENKNIIMLVNDVNGPDADLNQVVNDYFKTENFGVKKLENDLESENDKRAKILLKTTTQRIGERFQTGLLWKDDSVKLPDSFPMALHRLNSIERRMEKDPVYAASYKANIDDYIKKGYASKLTLHEAQRTSHRTWYLPHFGVTNPHKPGKLRLVFDAAAQVQGTSLNSVLLKGPDQYQSLHTILFKFREGPVAICADIKEMFHQIMIRPEDQDSQRFLWRNGNKNNTVEKFKMISMTFGATCSPCSAQYIKNKNAMEMSQHFPEAANAIVNNHYVDDYVQSFDNEKVAIQIATDVKNIHKRAGFELIKFVSNSKTAAKILNEGNINNTSVVNMNKEGEGSVDKILGMYWDTQNDKFIFHCKFHRVPEDIMAGRRRPTKREILSIIMSIFDPFGFLANFMIYAKIIIQDVWKASIDWDDHLPDDIYERWMQWQTALKEVEQFEMPRCYSKLLTKEKKIELHIFVDASELAFVAVAYLRIQDGEQVEISFVAGKTKCAPKKVLSVPRLELQAAVLGSRLKHSIVENHDLQFERTLFWSDSKTVLSWINSEQRNYKPFVAHRISEILDCSQSKDWFWVPTKLNPADDATRTKFPPKFSNNSRWLHGPSFLMSNEELWPKFPNEVVTNTIEELRHQLTIVVENDKSVIHVENFSSYSKLKRVTGWVLRYKQNLKSRISNREMTKGSLAAEELHQADIVLCKMAQRDWFSDEIDKLGADKRLDKTSTIYQLTPILDENRVLRLGGRINAAICVSEYTRQPIIMPKNHYITKLIIKHYHDKLFHQNQEMIICEIRKRYWVADIRAMVKKCKKECQLCKIEGAKPIPPLMGQLPRDRLEPYVRPFTFTGLDYFGPYWVTIGRRREKRWVALFTCLTIRAVHLELAADLSADACLICIRNFINVRGIPIRIRSDNGTNFIAADKELRNNAALFDYEKVGEQLNNQGIQWVFNCPANPEAGGCWERLVKSIKRVLYYTLKEEAPRVETLRSLLIEAANIVNSRPLTHVPLTSDEHEPLTPNHFLLGSNNSTQTPADDGKITYKRQWQIQQQLKNKLWKRWIHEYLPTLTRRTKWFQMVKPIQEKDLVLICESGQGRNQWRRGRVVKVNTAPDGQVRTAIVQTSSGQLRRPVSKLPILEGEVDGKSSAAVAIYGGRDVTNASAGIKTN